MMAMMTTMVVEVMGSEGKNVDGEVRFEGKGDGASVDDRDGGD